jgi:hypothetical protein
MSAINPRRGRGTAALDRLCRTTPHGYMASLDRLFLDRIPRWRVFAWWLAGLVRLRAVPRPGPRRRLPELFVIPTQAGRDRTDGRDRPETHRSAGMIR